MKIPNLNYVASENRIKINHEKLLKLYMTKVNKIADDFECKVTFSPKEIVDIVCEILEKCPELINE